MDLLAADGTTVIENDDDDGTANGADGTIESGLASAIAGRTLVTGGTYYVRVRAFSAALIIDPYKLYVVVTNTAAVPETEANDTAATANIILSSGNSRNVFSGSIGAAGDVDYYAVALTAGDVVFVSADADPERDGTGTDLVVEVRDPADAIVLSIDSSITGSLANPPTETAPCTALVSGTYYVKVRHFSATGTGTYHLMVANMTQDQLGATSEVEPNDTAPTATVLTLDAGRAIGSASIGVAADVDFWRIDGVAPNARIWVSTDTGGTQNPGATSRDTVMDLIAADGTTVIENDDDDGTANGADGTIESGLASAIAGGTLTTGGTYYIRVRAFSATAIVSPYKLYVVVTQPSAAPETEPNNTAATANDMLSGSAVTNVFSGSIAAAGDVDYYAMNLTAGEVIFVSADADPERDGTGTDLVVEVRDPADALVLSIDSSITGSLANPAAEAAPYTALVSGTYYVKVRHVSAIGTGTYHLMVANMTKGADTLALLGARSRRVHGAAGTFDLQLSLVPTAPSTEPRQGPAQTIVFNFNKAITGGSFFFSEGTVGTGVGGVRGNDVIIDLTGVTNQQYVTVSLINLSDTDGGTGGSASVRIGFLLGDVNQNRVVTLADLGLVNQQLAQLVTAANYLKDINVSGTLSLADKGITNANLTKALPAP
jgi:hypothetical protein